MKVEPFDGLAWLRMMRERDKDEPLATMSLHTLDKIIADWDSRRDAAAPVGPQLVETLVEILPELGLGLTTGATIQSVQRRLSVGTATAMRLLALRETIKALATPGAPSAAPREKQDE